MFVRQFNGMFHSVIPFHSIPFRCPIDSGWDPFGRRSACTAVIGVRPPLNIIGRTGQSEFIAVPRSAVRQSHRETSDGGRDCFRAGEDVRPLPLVRDMSQSLDRCLFQVRAEYGHPRWPRIFPAPEIVSRAVAERPGKVRRRHEGRREIFARHDATPECVSLRCTCLSPVSSVNIMMSSDDIDEHGHARRARIDCAALADCDLIIRSGVRRGNRRPGKDVPGAGLPWQKPRCDPSRPAPPRS